MKSKEEWFNALPHADGKQIPNTRLCSLHTIEEIQKDAQFTKGSDAEMRFDRNRNEPISPESAKTTAEVGAQVSDTPRTDSAKLPWHDESLEGDDVVPHAEMVETCLNAVMKKKSA